MKTKTLILALFLGNQADGASLNRHHKAKWYHKHPHHKHHSEYPEVRLAHELDSSIKRSNIDFEGKIRKSIYDETEAEKASD
jgi:hypothetical protein